MEESKEQEKKEKEERDEREKREQEKAKEDERERRRKQTQEILQRHSPSASSPSSSRSSSSSFPLPHSIPSSSSSESSQRSESYATTPSSTLPARVSVGAMGFDDEESNSAQRNGISLVPLTEPDSEMSLLDSPSTSNDLSTSQVERWFDLLSLSQQEDLLERLERRKRKVLPNGNSTREKKENPVREKTEEELIEEAIQESLREQEEYRRQGL